MKCLIHKSCHAHMALLNLFAGAEFGGPVIQVYGERTSAFAHRDLQQHTQCSCMWHIIGSMLHVVKCYLPYAASSLQCVMQNLLQHMH